VPAAQAEAISQALRAQGETVYQLGEITECAATDAQTVVL
jgi:phosphoribosylaminoimidazole (AIR) synthetase